MVSPAFLSDTRDRQRGGGGEIVEAQKSLYLVRYPVKLLLEETPSRAGEQRGGIKDSKKGCGLGCAFGGKPSQGLRV